MFKTVPSFSSLTQAFLAIGIAAILRLVPISLAQPPKTRHQEPVRGCFRGGATPQPAAAFTISSDDGQKVDADRWSAFLKAFLFSFILKCGLSRSRSLSLARSDRVLTAATLKPSASAVSCKEWPSMS